MGIKVSIVVPVYNVEPYLERCVESLLNQTLKEIEIILVDDGSSDLSPQLCDTYSEKYEKIRVIHKANAGLGMARNSGLDMATGEYVAFVDSDDYIDKEMYERLYSVAKQKDLDIVISGGFISEGAYRTTRVGRETEKEILFEGADVKRLALKMTGALPEYPLDYEHAMSVCKGIYNRKLIVENEIRFLSERELISEDLLFHYDILQYAKKVMIIPECFYHYCLNMASLTKTYQKERFQRNVQFYKYVLELIEKRDYAPDDSIYAERLLLASARVAITQVVGYYQTWNKKMMEEIANICNNEVLRRTLKKYPINRLPIKQRIFAHMMKYRMYVMLYATVKMNEMTK